MLFIAESMVYECTVYVSMNHLKDVRLSQEIQGTQIIKYTRILCEISIKAVAKMWDGLGSVPFS